MHKYLVKENKAFFYCRPLPKFLKEELDGSGQVVIKLLLRASTQKEAEKKVSVLEGQLATLKQRITELRKTKIAQGLQEIVAQGLQEIVRLHLTIMGIIPAVRSLSICRDILRFGCPYCGSQMVHNSYTNDIDRRRQHWAIRYACYCVICGEYASAESFVFQDCNNVVKKVGKI